MLVELDAGRTDSAPVRRWLDADAPFAYLLRAVSLARARCLDEAAGDVARAVALAPQSVLVRTAAARIRFVLRDYTAALADLDAAAVIPAEAPASARAAAASALDWKFELTRRLGGYIEGLKATAQALALDHDNPQRNLGRFQQVARLLQFSGNDEGSLRAIEAALGIEPQSTELYMCAAGLHCRLGDVERTRRAIDTAIALSPPGESARAVALRLDGARYFIELGASADAGAHLRRALDLDPGNAQVLALLAELALWAGKTSEAAQLAEDVIAANLAAGWRLRGALHVLVGEYAQGVADLDEALRRDEHDYEAHVWRGEALYRTGQLQDAFAALNQGGEMCHESPDYLASQILRLLVQAARGDFPGLPDQGVPEALDRMFPGEREATDPSDVPALCALLERALLWMRGNRRFTATYVRPDDPDAEPVPLRLRPSPRGPSKLALWLLTTESLAAAESGLDRVHHDYPRSPEPYCYHGELYLYLGDYVAARRQFDQALVLYDRTRWAFIGLGAVELLEGRPERTLPLLERSLKLSRGAGPTLFVYRGEALLRLGRLDAAIADLEYAAQLNPTRVSAWIDLALARDEAGDHAAPARGLEHLRRVAPGLVHDAARAAGITMGAAEDAAVPGRDALRALFETMLRMMRGNRSSTCVTYFTDDGYLRVVPPVPAVDAQIEARDLDLVRAALERALGLARN
jgi:tetratricopeptide (TPR) repeat protein